MAIRPPCSYPRAQHCRDPSQLGQGLLIFITLFLVRGLPPLVQLEGDLVVLGIFYLNPILLFQTFPFLVVLLIYPVLFFLLFLHMDRFPSAGGFGFCLWHFLWPAFGSAARLLSGLSLRARRLPDHLRGKSFWVDVAGGPHNGVSCVHTSRAHCTA